MSDEAIKKKKKLTKKSKILIIVLSIVAFLLIATVLGGVIALNQYCKTKDYTVISTSDNVTLVAHRGMRSVAPETQQRHLPKPESTDIGVLNVMFTELKTVFG